MRPISTSMMSAAPAGSPPKIPPETSFKGGQRNYGQRLLACSGGGLRLSVRRATSFREGAQNHGFLEYRSGRGRPQAAVPGGRSGRSTADGTVSQQGAGQRQPDQTVRSRGQRL